MSRNTTTQRDAVLQYAQVPDIRTAHADARFRNVFAAPTTFAPRNGRLRSALRNCAGVTPAASAAAVEKVEPRWTGRAVRRDMRPKIGDADAAPSARQGELWTSRPFGPGVRNEGFLTELHPTAPNCT